MDAAWALYLEPLAGDPVRREEVMAEMRMPLPGTEEAKRRAQEDALGAVGLSAESVSKMLTARRAAKGEAPAT